MMMLLMTTRTRTNLNFCRPFREHVANKLEIIGTETNIMRQLRKSIDNCLITYFNIGQCFRELGRDYYFEHTHTGTKTMYFHFDYLI